MPKTVTRQRRGCDLNSALLRQQKLTVIADRVRQQIRSSVIVDCQRWVPLEASTVPVCIDVSCWPDVDDGDRHDIQLLVKPNHSVLRSQIAFHRFKPNSELLWSRLHTSHKMYVCCSSLLHMCIWLYITTQCRILIARKAATGNAIKGRRIRWKNWHFQQARSTLSNSRLATTTNSTHSEF